MRVETGGLKRGIGAEGISRVLVEGWMGRAKREVGHCANWTDSGLDWPGMPLLVMVKMLIHSQTEIWKEKYKNEMNPVKN